MTAIIRQNPRKFLAAGAIGAFLFSPYSRDIFRTPSVQNMESKFNAVGASTEHTSAVANPKKDANAQKTPEADEKRRGTPYQEKSAPEPRADVSCSFNCLLPR
ncbi:MAG: hypothetical protein LQ351_007396 [Letrouitia transgressa]|nr:MAG: hypothetical protein LQ351_007396 [Letrouitia transgressa]